MQWACRESALLGSRDGSPGSHGGPERIRTDEHTDCGETLVETPLATERNPAIKQHLRRTPESKPREDDETFIKGLGKRPEDSRERAAQPHAQEEYDHPPISIRWLLQRCSRSARRAELAIRP